MEVVQGKYKRVVQLPPISFLYNNKTRLPGHSQSIYLQSKMDDKTLGFSSDPVLSIEKMQLNQVC